MKKNTLGYIAGCLFLFGLACFLGAAGGIEREGRTVVEQLPYVIAGIVQFLGAWFFAHEWEKKDRP